MKRIIFLCLVLFADGWFAIIRPARRNEVKPTIHCILGEEVNAYALAFSPDGKRLLSGEEGDRNSCIVEWDIATKSVSQRIDSGFSEQIMNLSYSTSGKFITVGHIFGVVSVRNPRGKTLLWFRSVETPLGSPLRLAFTVDRKEPYVYTIVYHSIAQRRSIRTGRTSVYAIPWESSPVMAATATRDGRTFVCCYGKSMHVYANDFSSGPSKRIDLRRFLRESIHEIAISDDSSIVLLSGFDSELALFDLKNDRLIKKWKQDDPPTCTAVPLHNHNWFVTGHDTGEIRIWDDKGNLRSRFAHGARPVEALALRSDNGLLAASGVLRRIEVWDLRGFLRNSLLDKKVSLE